MIISKKYEVLSQLGEGGMGVVYKVRHTALESVSALKVLSTHFGDHPDLVKRFYREARVLARLNHRNIVRVIDIERDEDLKFYYFVMEFVEGRTLRDHLKDSGPLSFAQVLTITKQVAAALHYAHNYQPPVIHRDIKPTNIMIEDGSQRVVVMDFGIAKDLGDTEQTRVGTMLGTLRYAPPEQLRYEPLDGGADVYALGMVMYEALLGSHPYAGLDEYQVLTRVMSPEEHDLGFPPGTPESFVALVTKAIRKDRSQRYRTMAELLQDIDACDPDKTPRVAVTGPVPGRATPAYLAEQSTEIALPMREDNVRVLGAQRDRRQLQRLREQVAEYKEKARRQGAAELAPALYQSACGAEDLAHAQTQGDQLGPACQSLEEALAGFKAAAEQAASAGLEKQAGQARAQTAAAKVEADRYGATERAQTVYRNGLMLQAKADALWQNQSYREASDLYGEAQSRFQDAQGLAHRAALLEDEAKAAGAKAREAREAAVKEGVEEHAADPFWEAVRAERRADTALAQSELAQARDLYLAAVEQYAGARRQAERERRRKPALAAQAEALAARQVLASPIGAAEQGAYRQGQEAEQRADIELGAEGFEAAAEAYREARARYEEACVPGWRRLAEEARARAAEARKRFPAEHAEAEEAFRRAGAEREARRALAAAEGYREAARAWTRMVEDFERLLARERSESLRQALGAARAAADPVLRGFAVKAWAAADQRAQDAERAWQEERYAEAAGLYESALGAYAEAHPLAEAARDEQQAVQIRTRAEQAEAAARAAEAPEFAQAVFTRARAAQQQGGKVLEARRWAEAQRAYGEAERLYREARDAAERGRARSLAEVASGEARAARDALRACEAPKAFAARIEQTEAQLAEAQSALRQDRYDVALAGFEQTAETFRQLREEVTVHQARDRAQQAQAKALAAQRERGERGAWGLKRAKKVLARGQRELALARYEQACASFEQAASQLAEGAAPRPWIWALPVLALVAVAGYYLWAGREPPAVVPPVSEAPKAKSIGPKSKGPKPIEPAPRVPVPPEPAAKPQPVGPLKLIPSPDAGQPIALAEGASQPFALKLDEAAAEPLRYAWSLDGAPQSATGPTWSYAPDFQSAARTPKEVKVVVSDAGGRSGELRWQVAIADTNRPPRLAALPTKEALTVKPGETLRFSVQGEDPDPDDALRYLWSVDGAPAAQGERFELKSGTAGARQQIEVAVVDRAGWSVRRRWDVAVEGPAAPVLTVRAVKPRIADGDELVLAPGQSQTFSIEVGGAEPARLRYAWELDGEQQATGSRYTYRVPASATGAKTVRVVVSGAEGPPIEYRWPIRFSAANRPPAIADFAPGDTRIQLASGAAQRFAVEAKDADPGEPLTYGWFLDGRQVGKGSAFELDAKVPAGQHRVEVRVSDKAGATATQRWDVAIAAPASPPAITEVKPAGGRIGAEAEAELEFSAVARLPGGGAVSYEWRLDAGPSRKTSAGKLRLPPLPAGSHTLAVVAVSPEGLRSTPRDWTIEIKPKATKTAVAESDVRDWLEVYRRAWEGKDVDLLIQLGEVTRERAPQLREVLAGYDGLRVTVKDLKISIEGESAKVTFRREDTIDGRTVAHPGLKEVVLAKQANGRLTRRK